MGYEDLEVADGQTASAQYASTLGIADEQERQRDLGDLRAYCESDTLAMVRLREADASLEPLNKFNNGE